MKQRKATRPLDLDPRRWMPLAEGFQRASAALGSIALAAQDLHDKLLRGLLQAAYRAIVYSTEHPHGHEISGLIERARWEHYKPWGSGDGSVRLRRIIKEAGDENLAGGGVYFFIRRAEFDRFYPPPQPAAADSLRPPQRRRGPVPTHDWFSICGEITRRCIHPKTARVQVPDNESELAGAVLDWLAAQGLNTPAPSEMREAVKRVCAALRTVQR
jgi:hypothetical protein